MNLADARFRHAEGLGDFPQPQVFKIIKRQHLALHFGKLLEALLDQAGHLALGGGVAGVDLRVIGDEVVAAGAVFAVIAAMDGVQANIGGGPDYIEQVLVFGGRETEGLGHFVVGGNAAAALGKFVHGLLNFFGLVMNGTGHPIQPAQFVKDRAAMLLLPLAWRKMRAIERAVLGAALLFPFVFLLVLSVRSDWGMWPWYAWVWRPALCASLALWFGAARPMAWVQSRAIQALVAAAVLVRLATTVWSPGQLDFYQAAVDVRDFAVTHPGVYAMGDRAGMLAYLLPQPLVQTEGLVMDRDFLRHVERQDDLWQTLALYKVRYYIGTSWDDEPAYRDGCFRAVEPVMAGADSPHMHGVICEAPLLRVKHDDVETMVFRLK